MGDYAQLMIAASETRMLAEKWSPVWAEHRHRISHAERLEAAARELLAALRHTDSASGTAALSTPAPDTGAELREALEQAVDAMAFYMLPSAMDGGIGECAAITNTKAALERARAALQRQTPEPGSHDSAEGVGEVAE